MSKIDELKKKLEKQAEKSCALNDRIHVDCFVSGYLKGSLPREKRIAELEESNRELKKLVQQREQRGLEVQEDLLKEKEELEQENAELKKEADFFHTEKGEYKSAFLKEVLKKNKITQQLTKAKEILRRYWHCSKCASVQIL